MTNFLLLLILVAVVFSHTDIGDLLFNKEVATYLHERDGLKYEVNQEDPFTGDYGTYWTSNGKKKKSMSYKDGKWEGSFISWYVNGQKKERNKIDVEIGSFHTFWYENGQKKSELYWDWKTGIKHFTSWYENNGQKKSEGRYENNFADGKSKYLVEGEWNDWYESGNIKQSSNYKGGKRNGSSVSWYENGQKADEAMYVSGMKNGHAVMWHKNGQIERESNFRKDKLNGSDIWWNESGKKILVQAYQDGILIESGQGANGL